MSTGRPEGSSLPPPAPSSTAWPAPAEVPRSQTPPTVVTTPPPGAWLLLGVALAAVIGALLPWAEVRRGLQVPGSGHVDGTAGDGRITIALGIVVGLAAVLAFLAPRLALWAGALALVASVLLVAIAIANIADVHRLAGRAQLVLVEVEVGSGLWLTLAAGIVGIVGSVLLVARRRS